MSRGIQSGVLAKFDKKYAHLLCVSQCLAQRSVVRIWHQSQSFEEGTLIASRRVCFQSFCVTYFMFVFSFKRGVSSFWRIKSELPGVTI